MGAISRRNAQRQSWAAKWAANLVWLLETECELRDLNEHNADQSGSEFEDILEDPVEQLLSAGSQQDFEEALVLAERKLQAKNLGFCLGMIHTLLEESAGLVYWEQGPENDRRHGLSGVFAIGVTVAMPVADVMPVLDELTLERLHRMLVETHQVHPQARVVMLRKVVDHGSTVDVDAWQERRIGVLLQNWAAAHGSLHHPDAAEADRILEQANVPVVQSQPDDQAPADAAEGQDGQDEQVGLRSFLIMGLAIPPGQVPDDGDEDEEAESFEVFPLMAFGTQYAEFLHAQLEYEQIQALRRGENVPGMSQQEAEAIQAEFEGQPDQDIANELELVRQVVLDMEEGEPALAALVTDEATSLSHKMLQLLGASFAGRGHQDDTFRLLDITPLQTIEEAAAASFHNERALDFQIGALAAAQDRGLDDCSSMRAYVFLDSDGLLFHVELVIGPELVHVAHWPVAFSENADDAAGALLQVLGSLDIQVNEDTDETDEDVAVPDATVIPASRQLH